MRSGRSPAPGQKLLPGFIDGAVGPELDRHASVPPEVRLQAVKWLATQTGDPAAIAKHTIQSLFCYDEARVRWAIKAIGGQRPCPPNAERALGHLYEKIEAGQLPCASNPEHLSVIAYLFKVRIARALLDVDAKQELSLRVYADILRCYLAPESRKDYKCVAGRCLSQLLRVPEGRQFVDELVEPLMQFKNMARIIRDASAAGKTENASRKDR